MVELNLGTNQIQMLPGNSKHEMRLLIFPLIYYFEKSLNTAESRIP